MKEKHKRTLLTFLLFMVSSYMSVHAEGVEYLTLNVGGTPVIIVLAEHPVITYTDNTLHIQTAKETIDVPVSQISGTEFSETSNIRVVENKQLQIQEGSLYFNELPRGSKVSVFAANGIEVSSANVDEDGRAIVNMGSLPKGIFVVKSATQTFKITNK